MVDQATFDKLNKYDWESIILKLTRYAKSSLDVLSFARVKVPKDRQPQDFAKEAIRLLYEGNRVWDQAKYPDLEIFLKKSVIDSLISNSIESPEVKRKAKAKIPANSGKDEDSINLADIIDSKDPTAEMEIIAQETLKKIRNAVKDNDDEALIFEELIKSSKPQEICADFGLRIDDVRNIIKRIRRKASTAVNNLNEKCLVSH